MKQLLKQIDQEFTASFFTQKHIEEKLEKLRKTPEKVFATVWEDGGIKLLDQLFSEKTKLLFHYAVCRGGTVGTRLAVTKKSIAPSEFQILVVASTNDSYQKTLEQVDKYKDIENLAVVIPEPIDDQTLEAIVKVERIAPLFMQFKDVLASYMTKWNALACQKNFLILYKDEEITVKGVEQLNAKLDSFYSQRFSLSLTHIVANPKPVVYRANFRKAIKNAFKHKSASTYSEIAAVVSTFRDVPKYWEYFPNETLCQIKARVEEYVDERLKQDGIVFLFDIFWQLQKPPVCLRSCALSAYLFSFLISDYLYRDALYIDQTMTSPLSSDGLVSFIDNIFLNELEEKRSLKQHAVFIERLTPCQKTLRATLVELFDLQTPDNESLSGLPLCVCRKIEELDYPFVFVKYINQNPLVDMIMKFNSFPSYSMGSTRSFYRYCNQFGAFIQENRSLVDDLKQLLHPDVQDYTGKRFLIDNAKQLNYSAFQPSDLPVLLNTIRHICAQYPERKWLWDESHWVDDIKLHLVQQKRFAIAVGRNWSASSARIAATY